MNGKKAVMMAIQPEWCGYIFDGRKYDELRKNKPDLACPFKVYVYCTKHGDKTNLMRVVGAGKARTMIGKVCAEFECDRITFVRAVKQGPMDFHLQNTALLRTQLTDVEIFRYIAGNVIDRDTFVADGFAWHISKGTIYAEPKSLDEFRMYYGGGPVKRPPQSWFYVEEDEQ